QVFANWREERQATFDVEIDVCAAMLHVGCVDQLAIDVVAQDVFNVVRIGLNSEAGRGVARKARRRGYLVRFDEPDSRKAFDVHKESQERFTIAVDTSNDFLLPQLPTIFLQELIDYVLHLKRNVLGGVHPLANSGPVAVARPDDVADAIFM